MTTTDKAKQIWQFLSLDGKIQVIEGFEFDEFYDKDFKFLEDKCLEVCDTDWDKLDSKYKEAFIQYVPFSYNTLSKQSDWIRFFNN